MSWSSTIPYVLAGIVILFVPGLLVLWASRIRGMPLVTTAPAVTVSLAATSALVAPVLGLRWSPLPVIIATIVVAVVAWVVTHFVFKNGRPRTRPSFRVLVGLGHLGAVGVAVFLIGRRLVAVFGTPDAFSQTFDNVFHLNAVRYILDTGSGSSFSVSSMTGGSFYPSAWHDMVALLAGVTGASVPVAVNITNLLVAAVVWPLGCIFLAHSIIGGRVAVSVIAGVLSAAFGAFPMLLLDFGVLYPNFLGNALLPVAVGLGIGALGLGHRVIESPVVAWLLFLMALPGLTLAHPGSTMALLVLMLPPLLFIWLRSTRAIYARSSRRWLGISVMVALLLTGVAALVWVWGAVRPGEAPWQPFETAGRAIGEVVSSSAIGRSASWAVAILALVGIVSVISRRKQLWLVGMYGLMAALFVVVASVPFGSLRTFITGVWYNDPPRLASLLPVVILPLATIGAVRCWDRYAVPLVRALTSRLKLGQKSSMVAGKVYPVAVVGIIAAGLLVIGTQQANVREAQTSAAGAYRLTNESPLVSPDELALIKRLPDEVPEGATMIGNPWNGSALAYAFSGRKLLQLHLLGEVPVDATTVFDGLNAANRDPAVCPVVQRLRISYVLDFGHQELLGYDHGYRGLDDLVTNGVAQLVDSQGPAKLYKLTACGQ